MKSNVTLRGSGANETFLIFTGSNACDGLYATICFLGDTVWQGSTLVQPGQSNAATWTSGYSQGTTSITLSNIGSAGVSNGQYIYLDQANDTADNGALFICDISTPFACELEGGSPGRTIGGIDRNQIQMVEVISGCTSLCTGPGPFAVTITPGLYELNWRSSQNPGAWFGALTNALVYAGVENLSINASGAGTGAESGIAFHNAYNCWVTGSRVLNTNRNHIWLYPAAHITIESNYFYGTLNNASQSYGVEFFMAGDNLIDNNIFQQVTAPVVYGPVQGSVVAYNFSIDDYYYIPTYMQPADTEHDAGVLYNLIEGNDGAGFYADNFHGTGGLNIFFRNRLHGWEVGKTGGGTTPVWIDSYHRYENFIGNVLGTFGFHTVYETIPPAGMSNTTIYQLNYGNTEGSVTVANDPYVKTSLMRWGNYDTVNAANRFVPGEVPSGLTDGYANPVPANQVLPPSFYLHAEPNWWVSTLPWPGIGPDVTGGTEPNVGGHVYMTPAQYCYVNNMSGPSDGSGNALAFQPSKCYSDPPSAPTGLQAIVE